MEDIYKQQEIMQIIEYIKRLYQEFIENYSKLNGAFGLYNPIEIMFLFTYLVFNGYISVKHRHSFVDEKGGRVALLGAYTLTGRSCCRNDATMLCDILKKSGIESTVLFTLLTYMTHDEALITQEDVENEYKFFGDECAIRLLNDCNLELERRILNGQIDLAGFNLEKRFGFDHLITIARKDGISFYLDPINNTFYRKRKIAGLDVLASGVLACVPRASWIYNILYKYVVGADANEVRSILKGMNASLENELEARRKVSEITSNNQDVFEQFYRENAPLYEEVSMKLEMVRRK